MRSIRKSLALIMMALIMATMVATPAFAQTHAQQRDTAQPNTTDIRLWFTSTNAAGDGMWLSANQNFIVLNSIPADFHRIQFWLDGRFYEMNRATDGRAWFIPHSHTQRNVPLELTIRADNNQRMGIEHRIWVSVDSHGNTAIYTSPWRNHHRDHVRMQAVYNTDWQTHWDWLRATTGSPDVAAIRNRTNDVIHNITGDYTRARAIHTWVAENITLTATTAANNRADRVLNNWRASSQGFANLTVSMLHAAGIPARAVFGSTWANYGNEWHPSDTSRPGTATDHVWVEALIGSRWINLDPAMDARWTLDHNNRWHENTNSRTRNFDITNDMFSLTHSVLGWQASTGDIMLATPPIPPQIPTDPDPPIGNEPSAAIIFQNQGFRVNNRVNAQGAALNSGYFDTYIYQGRTYAWIRDIAYMMTLSGHPFDVGFSGGVITVTTGRNYTPTRPQSGGRAVFENTLRAGTNFVVGTTTIRIDGVNRTIETIIVDGYTFVCMTRLGQFVGYSVLSANRISTH